MMQLFVRSCTRQLLLLLLVMLTLALTVSFISDALAFKSLS